MQDRKKRKQNENVYGTQLTNLFFFSSVVNLFTKEARMNVYTISHSYLLAVWSEHVNNDEFC